MKPLTMAETATAVDALRAIRAALSEFAPHIQISIARALVLDYEGADRPLAGRPRSPRLGELAAVDTRLDSGTLASLTVDDLDDRCQFPAQLTVELSVEEQQELDDAARGERAKLGQPKEGN